LEIVGRIVVVVMVVMTSYGMCPITACPDILKSFEAVILYMIMKLKIQLVFVWRWYMLEATTKRTTSCGTDRIVRASPAQVLEGWSTSAFTKRSLEGQL